MQKKGTRLSFWTKGLFGRIRSQVLRVLKTSNCSPKSKVEAMGTNFLSLFSPTRTLFSGANTYPCKNTLPHLRQSLPSPPLPLSIIPLRKHKPPFIDHTREMSPKSGEPFSKAADAPRKYQLEIGRRALEGNVIAVADTGSGKTLISVLLLKAMVAKARATAAATGKQVHDCWELRVGRRDNQETAQLTFSSRICKRGVCVC